MTDQDKIRNVVLLLDKIDGNDPEAAHHAADMLLLIVAPEEVQAAYGRLVERARWWASA